ncbi:MAG: DNA polymerase III subunit gamma/tau [Clostridia bacterium]|nr:DNA polymerase III subunit gamma/tau [Clostridia bacterium]
MAYQVLYRKYRPRVFEDVVGQPQVTVTLRNELKSGRVSHAYLFTGSRGTGKTTCAKILAKAVNCLSPHEGDPCGECEICRGIDNGSILDILEIDAASNNGVDNIRTLREEANYTPANCKFRVYIIDEVHMLSISAFNALLKTLEEPPEHVIFILATTELHKLPATILSRCQRFDFRRIAPKEIAGRLSDVAQREQVNLSQQAALLIANLADGALRDALSVLDQCIGVSRDLTEEKVREIVGIASNEYLFRMADAIFERNTGEVLEAVDVLYTGAKDIVRLAEDLSDHFRALMITKTMKDPNTVLGASNEMLAEYQTQAEKAPLSRILRAIDLLQDALERMNRGGNKRTELEMALIRICSREMDSSPEALLRRIEALEAGSTAVQPSSGRQPAEKPVQAKQKPAAEKPQPSAAERTEQPSEIPAESRIQNAEPAFAENEKQRNASVSRDSSGAQNASKDAQRFAQWPEILQILKNYSQSIASAFSGSSAYVSGASPKKWARSVPGLPSPQRSPNHICFFLPSPRICTEHEKNPAMDGRVLCILTLSPNNAPGLQAKKDPRAVQECHDLTPLAGIVRAEFARTAVKRYILVRIRPIIDGDGQRFFREHSQRRR